MRYAFPFRSLPTVGERERPTIDPCDIDAVGPRCQINVDARGFCRDLPVVLLRALWVVGSPLS
jgi:hypothetical protein